MATNFIPTMSTDEIGVGSSDVCLTDYLDSMETDVANKASSTHSHPEYMTEADATDAFAQAEHTHSDYAPATHTHDDLVELVDALDTAIGGKADASHTHAQSEIAGLEEKLAEIDTAIEALQAADDEAGGEVAPMLIATMRLGKLDNNSGAETASSTRICSDPIAIEGGKSYWQVNDNGVNMYVLIYDSEEVFLEYMGSYASGAEIAVTNANAAYMRLGSLIGNYDTNNVYRIYDADPSGATAEEEGFTQADADLLYAPIDHTHNGFAASEHTHDGLHTHTNKDVLDGITAEKVAAWDAGTGSNSGTGVDAYTKTESDNRYATKTELNSVDSNVAQLSSNVADFHSELNLVYDAINGKANADHSHSGYAVSGHSHTASEVGAAASNHSHTASEVGAAASNHTHSGYAPSNHSHSDYLLKSGGTVTGEVNFSGGLIRVGGQQSIYDSGTMVTLSTNNRKTMIAGSEIYSKVAISVSSDERLKENIVPVDDDKCVALIDGIDVKTFNYIGNDVPCMGVIAQDLQRNELAKFFVSTGEDGYLSVKATDLVFPLIAAVQNLSKRVQELESK